MVATCNLEMMEVSPSGRESGEFGVLGEFRCVGAEVKYQLR